MLAEISKYTLMLVRDPKFAIQALFEDPNEIISDSSFLKEYKRIKKIKWVGETKAETHLGTLRIFGLVGSTPQIGKGSNILTPRGKMLKKLWKENKQKEFRNALAITILTNPHKHQLFKSFIDFTSRAKTVEEIKNKYKWRTGASLIAWSDLSGLIEINSNKKYIVVKKLEETNKPDIETVWLEVKKSYNEIRRMNHRKKLIIKYGDLRFRSASNLSLEDAYTFDKLFCDLMYSKYGQFINLHGTLVGDYDAYENLRYRGHLYPFISLTM